MHKEYGVDILGEWSSVSNSTILQVIGFIEL